jgi:hypothetical protein
MGLLLGDVLATISIIVFSGLAAWAGGVLSALLFPDRTEQASFDFEFRPWGTFFIGLGLALGVTFVGAMLFGIPATRAIGAFVWLVGVGIAVFGTGGLFRLVARRIRKSDGASGDYQAITRAGLLVCVAELMPFFGWFLLFPWVLITSLGAGCKKLFFYRVRHRVDAPPQPEAQ